MLLLQKCRDVNSLRQGLRGFQQALIEEDDDNSNADTDNDSRDSGFCDDTFIDERLDIIEKMVERNQTELIKVGELFFFISRQLNILGSNSGEETQPKF